MRHRLKILLSVTLISLLSHAISLWLFCPLNKHPVGLLQERACMCAKSLSHVRLCVTLRTVARQASLALGFSRQEYWSGLPCPPPGDLPDSGIKPISPMPPALAGRISVTSATWEDPAAGAPSVK